MRRRPWPIVILAVVHLLGPFGNLLLSAWVAHLTPEIFLESFLETSTLWGLIDFFGLLPLAGAAIYLCKKWSYPVFLVIALWTVLSNYRSWTSSPDQFPLWVLVATVALDVTVVGYFLLPAVRTIYLDPGLRWWESKPRYTADFPGVVIDRSGEKRGIVSDISEGGIFFSCPDPISTEKPVHVRFTSGPLRLEAEATVIYRRQGTRRGYGLKFTDQPKTRQSVKTILQTLRKNGVKAQGNSDWREDLITWSLTLAKTGKGLIPAPRKPEESGPDKTS